MTLSKNVLIGAPMPTDGEILSAYVQGIVVEGNGCGSCQRGQGFPCAYSFAVLFVDEFGHVCHGTNFLIAFRLVVGSMLEGLVK